MKDCNGKWLDGCETDTSKDTNNCGSCGMVCPTYPHSTTTCSNGICTPVCNAGWKNCNGDWKDGCETNVGTDCNNCGNCGSTCPLYPHSTRSCSNGKCTPMCSSGWKDCNGNWNDGCEVNVNSDVNNCGGCGKSCPCADVNGLPSCRSVQLPNLDLHVRLCAFVCINISTEHVDTNYENFVRQQSVSASPYWVCANTLLLLQFDLQQRELRSAMQERIQVRHLPGEVHQGIEPEKFIKSH